MPMRSAAQIRQEFIDFFVELHGHTFAPSSPVVPHDDPTLLFANAGMNQFKDVFLGTGTRDFNRAVNTQKCIRAGGKHNDLEDVGKDHYHHTFFEMLGNWSFGDYFKEDAITWAWQLLTQVWELDKNRLYATVFGGDEKDGLPADTEAEELWRDVTDIDPSHITRWDRKDNFWEMGETGPCGPCSEIHYDFTGDLSGGPLVNTGSEQAIEIWNLVFIQYNRQNDGSLIPLPAKHVDTGMGFERIARVIQNRASNYDIDLWTPLFMTIEQRSGARAYGGRLTDPIDVAYRVIADHLRCLTFAITDGAMPGNEGRGYVLRRILRRAVRHARQTLGVPGPFLHQLVLPLVDSMGEVFPELGRNPDRVIEVVKDEEESFGRTLDRGLTLFKEAARAATHEDARAISADDAFKLHDTYGFPVDLTQVMAEERGLSVDLDGYERLMEEARQRARAAGARGPGKAGTNLQLEGDQIARLKHLNVEPTIDEDKFHGRRILARVKAIWNGNDFDEHTSATTTTSEVTGVITNRTNFYAEMGGQVGDVGRMYTADGSAEFHVTDTKVFGGYVLHIGRAMKGRLSVADQVELEIDRSHRMPIMRNHTGTHLLNLALREVLGDQVDQKGSLVAPDRLRFDFAHNSAVKADELERIAAAVSDRIAENLDVFAEDVALDEAQGITGLRAVFGERYPDPVRVVSIGRPVTELRADPDNEQWQTYSVELCGGTHVPSTSEIVGLAITQEESVARGVRRIVAVTGSEAIEAQAAAEALAERLAQLEVVTGDRLPIELAELVEELDQTVVPLEYKHRLRSRLEVLQEKARTMQKQADKEGRANVVEQARALASTCADRPVCIGVLDDANAETLRAAMDVIRSASSDRQAMLIMSADHEQSKVAILAWVPDALIAKGLKAGNWVREVATVCGGGGGGRPDMAQAGGKDPSKVEDALHCAGEYAAQFVS
ncbi:MAG: alanine--tRNA ligase [Planctomycetes bacterium]|nr:alanine--tRNA ligase [Planctomycetota bacterium]